MFIKNLLVLLVLTGALTDPKRYFPEPADFSVDRQGRYQGTTMVTKKVYNEKKRCSANGTGKERLKILYQNGGNVTHTSNMLPAIETMLDSVRPHVVFMAENRMDTETRDRLTNQHGFCVEEIGPNERIWAAVKSTVPYTRRRDCELRGICSLWLEFGTGAKKYVVIGAYREFQRLDVSKDQRTFEAQKKRWEKFMKKVQDFILTSKMEVHLLGDLNLDTKRWPQLGSMKKGWKWTWFVDKLYEHLINGAGMNLSETDGVTWTSGCGTKSSCLDIHFCNKPDKVHKVSTSNEFTKDHQTLIVVRAENDQAGSQSCTKRKWSHVDYVWCTEFYDEFLKTKVAEELLRIQDADEVANRLTCALNVMLDCKWPVTTFKIKPQYAPYITQPLRELRKVKRRLWLQWKKTQDKEVYKKMRTVTNKLRHGTVKARKRWYGRKMADYRDSEKLWKFAKDNVGWKQDGTPTVIIKDGQRFTDPKQVADAVNDVLMKKVKDILAAIPDNGDDPLEWTRRWLEGKDFPEVDLTERVEFHEVMEAMKELNITDAAGHDHLTTRLIKRMRHELCPVIHHLINLCFEQDKMPLLWKLAKISPLYKSGDRFDAKNYRPVAVLPAMSKIIEKIVIGRLKKHVEKHNLLSDTQNAYRAKRSVTTAMIQLYDEILAKQDEGKDSACVFLDCSAAFDTIQHDVLMGKMKLYGVSEKSLAWVKSYLSDRAQFVSIGGVPSEIKRIEDGAFQGSIGGPWFFLLMINDIVVLGVGNGMSIYIYADDTCIRMDLSGNEAEDQSRLDDIMEKIVRYMQAAKLKFNFKKTEFVVASPKRHDNHKNLVLNFEGSVVKQQLHARLLGLQVSWNLTHTWYVSDMKNSLLASLSQRLYILQKLAPKCPKKCVKNLAHGLIFSKLCFGIQYWSRPLTETLWNQIVVLVNRAARAVLKVRPLEMHVLDLYRCLNWLTPAAWRSYMDLVLFYNIKVFDQPANLSSMFMSGEQQFYLEEARRMRTRSVSQNSIRRTQENDSLGMRAGSFVPRMVKVYNELDPEYKGLPDVSGTLQERFDYLKIKLRSKCQWDTLGLPFYWPTLVDCKILDRASEIYGLGIDSDTTDDDEDYTTY